MKRVISVFLAMLMVCVLCITTNANDYTLDPYYVFHTSYDIFNGALISNLPSANEFTVEAGSDTGKFTGWTATSEEIVGFAYSVNEGDYVVKESFMQATEQAVADAAQAVGGSYWSRFAITVPLLPGENFICLAVVFADDEIEDIWKASVYLEDDGIPDPEQGMVENPTHIKAPGVYKLTKDITGDKMLVDGQYTIDLCGHKWTGSLLIDGSIVNIIDTVGGGVIESTTTDTLTLVNGELYATGITVKTKGSGSDAFWIKSGKAVLIDCTGYSESNAAVHNDNRQSGNSGNADLTIIGGNFSGKYAQKVQKGSTTVIKGNCTFESSFYLASGGDKTWAESFAVDAADGTIDFDVNGDFATVTYEATQSANELGFADAYFEIPAVGATSEIAVLGANNAKYTVSLVDSSADDDKVVVKVKFTANEGYSFTDNASFRINNAVAAKTGDGEYEATFVRKKISKYTLSFDLGGHGAAIDAININEGEAITAPADPTAEGWIFGGWYTDDAFTKSFDFSKGIKTDTTVYAKWTAEVKPTQEPTQPPVTQAPATQAPAEEDSGCGSSIALAHVMILFGAAVVIKRKK